MQMASWRTAVFSFAAIAGLNNLPMHTYIKVDNLGKEFNAVMADVNTVKADVNMLRMDVKEGFAKMEFLIRQRMDNVCHYGS